jgi:hypothetical protein
MATLSLFDCQQGYHVSHIPKHDTHDLLLNKHYARRLPNISYAFGLFHDGELRGVVTYGKPPSNHLCSGICGPQYGHLVIELNRLCLVSNEPNEASRLVAGSLKLLPKPAIVVSFADTTQQHVGYVYQATNFIYTGLSKVRKDYVVKNLEHLHSRSITAKAAQRPKGVRTIDILRETYGDDLQIVQRPRKHRYIMFLGNKKEKREFAKSLKYAVEAYPKGDSCAASDN